MDETSEGGFIGPNLVPEDNNRIERRVLVHCPRLNPDALNAKAPSRLPFRRIQGVLSVAGAKLREVKE